MPIKTQLELVQAARQLAATLLDEKSDLKVTRTILTGFDGLALDEQDFQEFSNQTRNERNNLINLRNRPTFTQQRLDKEDAEKKKLEQAAPIN